MKQACFDGALEPLQRFRRIGFHHPAYPPRVDDCEQEIRSVIHELTFEMRSSGKRCQRIDDARAAAAIAHAFEFPPAWRVDGHGGPGRAAFAARDLELLDRLLTRLRCAVDRTE